MFEGFLLIIFQEGINCLECNSTWKAVYIITNNKDNGGVDGQAGGTKDLEINYEEDLPT